jgi:hypothetical protein
LAVYSGTQPVGHGIAAATSSAVACHSLPAAAGAACQPMIDKVRSSAFAVLSFLLFTQSLRHSVPQSLPFGNTYDVFHTQKSTQKTLDMAQLLRFRRPRHALALAPRPMDPINVKMGKAKHILFLTILIDFDQI